MAIAMPHALLIARITSAINSQEPAHAQQVGLEMIAQCNVLVIVQTALMTAHVSDVLMVTMVIRVRTFARVIVKCVPVTAKAVSECAMVGMKFTVICVHVVDLSAPKETHKGLISVCSVKTNPGLFRTKDAARVVSTATAHVTPITAHVQTVVLVTTMARLVTRNVVPTAMDPVIL